MVEDGEIATMSAIDAMLAKGAEQFSEEEDTLADVEPCTVIDLTIDGNGALVPEG